VATCTTARTAKAVDIYYIFESAVLSYYFLLFHVIGKADMEVEDYKFVRLINGEVAIVLSRQQNADGINSLTVLELARRGATGAGDLYVGMPEVGLIDGREPFGVARDEIVDTMVLILKERYLSSGVALYFPGMKDVYFIVDTGNLDNYFTLGIFEEVPDEPYVMARPSAAVVRHQDKCDVIMKVHKAMALSSGVSAIGVDTHVSYDFWDALWKCYPEGDGQPTQHRWSERHPNWTTLLNGHTTVRKPISERCLEVMSFLPLEVLRGFLSQNCTWVGT
jgi:hypothetical protein